METNNRFLKLKENDRLFCMSDGALDYNNISDTETVFNMREFIIDSIIDITDKYIETQIKFPPDDFDFNLMLTIEPEEDPEYIDFDSIDTVANIYAVSQNPDIIKKLCKEKNIEALDCIDRKIKRLQEMKKLLKDFIKSL